MKVHCIFKINLNKVYKNFFIFKVFFNQKHCHFNHIFKNIIEISNFHVLGTRYFIHQWSQSLLADSLCVLEYVLWYFRERFPSFRRYDRFGNFHSCKIIAWNWSIFCLQEHPSDNLAFEPIVDAIKNAKRAPDNKSNIDHTFDLNLLMPGELFWVKLIEWIVKFEKLEMLVKVKII